MHSMNDTSRFPSVLVVSTTSHNSDPLSRSAAVLRKQTRRWTAAISCHWGSPQVIVDVATDEPKSLALAASATQLLRTAGLMQSNNSSEQTDSRHIFEFGDSNPQPPMIHVSIPAHFGADFLL